MYKFGVCYYDPTLGRWTQQDPLGGSLFDPSTGNRYAYANDDPGNLVDPTGTFTINPVGACGFAAATALVGLGVVTVVTGGGLIALDALTVPTIAGYAAGGCATGALAKIFSVLGF